MANLIDEEAVAIILDEAEKPFPHEKVKAKQVALRDKGSAGLERRMKMGMAVRRAKEAEKTGGSQRDAGKGWYHAREEFELWVNELVEEGYDLSDYTWDEMYEFYLDEALTGERYKKAVKKPGGTAYSRMVSADPKKRATRGGRGGESDFGAGDRGSGNKAARRAGKTVDEEFEIEEGMTMKDFKVNRQKNKRRESSADAEKRGHVGKEWYNSGRKYSPDEAKSSRANMDDEERRTRHRSAVDPDNEDDNNYSADKTKNPKKQRKQAAMGEMASFSDFMEARAEDKRGLEPTGANRKKQKTGVKLPCGGVAHPATSYSGGQNPHLRGKGGGSKEQRRAASRRYVDQPGGVYAKPENKQGEGRYAAKQARKRPDLGSRFD